MTGQPTIFPPDGSAIPRKSPEFSSDIVSIDDRKINDKLDTLPKYYREIAATGYVDQLMYVDSLINCGLLPEDYHLQGPDYFRERIIELASPYLFMQTTFNGRVIYEGSHVDVEKKDWEPILAYVPNLSWEEWDNLFRIQLSDGSQMKGLSPSLLSKLIDNPATEEAYILDGIAP